MGGDVSVFTERLPDSQVSLAVDIPQAMVDRAFASALDRLGRRVKIQGFRPGRAPRALIAAKVGPEALQDEVIETLVPNLLEQAMRDHSIEPLDAPRLKEIELEQGRPGRFTAQVSVMPEITLPDLSEISVDRPRTEITEKSVEERIEDLRARGAEYVPVEREIRAGDVVVADLEVEAEGQPRPEESRKGLELEIDPTAIWPELATALPEHRIGDLVEVDVAIPAEHSNPELAGRTLHMKVAVGGVKEKQLPDLDDEFAKAVSGGERETVEALREAIRIDLEERAQAVDVIALDQAVLKAVVERSSLAVPPPLVDREVHRELHDLEERLGRRGLTLEAFLQYRQQTTEQWEEEARPDVENRLKVEFVLGEVARTQGLEPTEQEVTEVLVADVERDEELARNVERYKRSAAVRDHFRTRLRRRRALERLVEMIAPAPPADPVGAKGEASLAPTASPSPDDKIANSDMEA